MSEKTVIDAGFSNGVIHCPICGRDIVADNYQDVLSGEHDGFVFVHDDIEHTEDDIEAINNGVQ